MAEIVNLRRARKRQERSEKDKRAAANRLKFGRPKAETRRAADERERAERAHEGRRLDED